MCSFCPTNTTNVNWKIITIHITNLNNACICIISCVRESVIPPVFFTGTGPLCAVHNLRHPRHDSRHVGKGSVHSWGSHHPTAVRCVPRVVTVRPGQQICHGHEEVIKCNANHHIVVDPNVSGDHHHSIAHTFKTNEKTNKFKINTILKVKLKKREPCSISKRLLYFILDLF